MAKQLIKSGNRIKGFIWECSKNGWSYAFGKPSAPSYIAFYGNNAPLTESEARQRVENL